MKEINTLQIGFLFGEELSQNEEIFTKLLDGNNLRLEYKKLEEQYKLFKQKNTNNTLAYKNSLEDEECYMFFPEPVGIKKTTFLEIRLMSMLLGSIDDELKELDKELYRLNDQKMILELYSNELI